MTEDESINSKLAERLSFFFSNANLRSDKFLRTIVLDPTNTDGFVSIQTLLKFNTIKQISLDPNHIIDAVKTVQHPKLKVNEAMDAICRVESFTKDMLDENIKLTLRVGNLPIVSSKDDDDNGENGTTTTTTTTMHYVHSRKEISALFERFGKVALVRLSWDHNHVTKAKNATGKCFVEFDSIESMEKAVSELCVTNDSSKDQEDVKQEDVKQEDVKQEDVKQEDVKQEDVKQEDVKQEDVKQENVKQENVKEEDVKQENVKEEDVKQEDVAPKLLLTIGDSVLEVKTMEKWLEEKKSRKRGSKRNIDNGGGDGDGGDGDGGAVHAKSKFEELSFKLDWTKGCVIELKGVPEGCDRETIHQTTLTFMGNDEEMKVRADYRRGEKNGNIHFYEHNDKITEFALQLNNGSTTIGGTKVESAQILEGEAEEKFYKDYIDFKTKQIRERAASRKNKHHHNNNKRRRR